VDRTLTYRVDREHFASVPIAFSTSTSVMYAESTPLLPGVPSGDAIPPIAPDMEGDDGMPALLSNPEDEDYGPHEDEAPPPLVGNDSDDEYDSDDDTDRPPLIHPDSDTDDDASKDEDPPLLVQDESNSEYDSDYEDEAELLDAAAANFVEATLHNGRAEYFRSSPAPPPPTPERLQTCGEWKATISALVNLDNIMEQIRTIRRGVDLTDSQRDALLQLLHECEGSFQFKGRKFDSTDLVKHHIRTGMATPIKQRAYRLSQREKRVIEQAVSEMLLDDIIESGNGPWASPPLITGKKDEGNCFGVDLRKVNAVTDKDSYPIPRINDLLDEIGQASWFSSIDLKSGYGQIALEEEDKAKTAFMTPTGLYQFKVMPFGLCNAPSTFQHLMDVVLAPYLGKFCAVYLDDILIYSKTYDDHLEHLQLVLEALAAANLHLHPTKSSFAMRQTLFLGHIIDGNGCCPDPDKIRCVENFRPPKNLTLLRAFIGLCSYYRRYVGNFSTKAAPLTALLRKDTPFIWGPDQQQAFELLK
jgi:hypothetical protein